MSFWLRKRQVLMMDARSGRPAKNFYVRFITIAIFLLTLILVPLGLGAWYAPFHHVQEIIPQNLQLKRENEDLLRKLGDVSTLNNVKDEQLESMRDQLAAQELKISDLTAQLRTFKSILDERKGTGIQVLNTLAVWTPDRKIDWRSLFVKGGSFPRYLQGSYQISALGEAGERADLSEIKMPYKFESHVFLQRKFDWVEAWQPVELEMVVFDYRGKEVLRKTVKVQGNS